jgi:hypothetical protein
MCARGVQACTPKGVQRGVQNQWFVRVACVVRNRKLVHPQFLPATKLNVQLNERSHDRGSQRNQGPFVVAGEGEQVR